jgi:hypothetical protein
LQRKGAALKRAVLAQDLWAFLDEVRNGVGWAGSLREDWTELERRLGTVVAPEQTEELKRNVARALDLCEEISEGPPPVPAPSPAHLRQLLGTLSGGPPPVTQEAFNTRQKQLDAHLRAAELALKELAVKW